MSQALEEVTMASVVSGEQPYTVDLSLSTCRNCPKSEQRYLETYRGDEERTKRESIPASWPPQAPKSIGLHRRRLHIKYRFPESIRFVCHTMGEFKLGSVSIGRLAEKVPREKLSVSPRTLSLDIYSDTLQTNKTQQRPGNRHDAEDAAARGGAGRGRGPPQRGTRIRRRRESPLFENLILIKTSSLQKNTHTFSLE